MAYLSDLLHQMVDQRDPHCDGVGGVTSVRQRLGDLSCDPEFRRTLELNLLADLMSSGYGLARRVTDIAGEQEKGNIAPGR